MFHNTLTENEIKTILSKNLLYLRITNKTPLSQKALSNVIKISPKTIFNLENGNITPAAYDVWLLANYFGCSMESLLTEIMCKEGMK